MDSVRRGERRHVVAVDLPRFHRSRHSGVARAAHAKNASTTQNGNGYSPRSSRTRTTTAARPSVPNRPWSRSERPTFPMSIDQCPLNFAAVARAYAAGTLTSSEAAAFEDHFIGCPSCSEPFQFTRHLAAAIHHAAERSRPSGPPPFAPSVTAISHIPKVASGAVEKPMARRRAEPTGHQRDGRPATGRFPVSPGSSVPDRPETGSPKAAPC